MKTAAFTCYKCGQQQAVQVDDSFGVRTPVPADRFLVILGRGVALVFAYCMCVAACAGTAALVAYLWGISHT